MKLLVTSALPYANGEIHLGHLAGAYLPADIYVKYHRLKGTDVIFICGSDEHGVPITIAAQRAGISPKELVDHYHPLIKQSFEKFGIEFDNYSRTSLSLHYRTVQDFFLQIYRRGFITPKTTSQLYCPRCKMFLADRYVEGACPSCGNNEARGDQCEQCGKWLEPFELIDPRCKVCGMTPERRETVHWFFRLSQFETNLRTWLASKTHWKPNVMRFCEGWLKRGLVDRPITRDLSWGVPVPLPEAAGKVFYVWFDAPIGYISATQDWAESLGRPDLWKDYWFNPQTKLVHFIGKDNIVFHAIVWPAMLMAHDEFILPSEIPANEFLNLEGAKLSTSRNRAIWLSDYLSQYPPDPLRYALAINLPENRDVDFTWADFHSRNNNELADILGNFINRVVVFIKRYYSGKIPQFTGTDSDSEKVIGMAQEIVVRIATLIEGFQIKDAAREMMNLAAIGNRYFDHSAPWRTFSADRAQCNRTMAVCSKLISMLEIITYPFLPFTSRKIAKMLNLGKRTWDDVLNPAVPSELGETEILFQKLPEKIIIQEKSKLGPDKKEKNEREPSMITIDEFKKIDLRVALVKSAERIPGTSKLLKLVIDLGKEERQIVAGIGETYSPEAVVGKQIVVVANLQPATIRGVESFGMLLAAVDGKQVALIRPEQDVTPGTAVT
ncbi:MAG: methionine--tRNA ligase [candidate division WOR-3 bacterium]